MSSKRGLSIRVVFSILACLLLVLALACGSESDPDQIETKSATDESLAEAGVVNFSYGECIDTSGYCARFHFGFKDLLKIDDPLRSVIEDSIMSRTAATLINSCESENLELFAGCQGRELSAAYEEFVGQFPDTRQRWFDSTIVQIANDAERVVGVSVDRITYSGGAHPNRWTFYLNFDKHNAEYISLLSVVRPECEDSLRKLGEQAFRSAVNLGPGEGLSDAGFWFPDSLFYLPGNFLLTDSGITFRFNPYEIGPYSEGAIEFSVDRAVLGACISSLKEDVNL